VPDLQQEGFAMYSTDLSDELLQTADCVVIVTHHASYDWAQVAVQARTIVDTRNALSGMATNGHVVSL
jgi:UDP-N-acetyl-D-glucosamine dehydrogenase